MTSARTTAKPTAARAPRPRRTNVVEKLLHACREDTVLFRNRRVVVAVSGGPDSTALLHALTRASRRLGLDIVVAHLDHGLRTNSAADAEAVARLSADLEVELVARRLRSGARLSEDGARRARYRFLESVAAEHDAETIALGHTGDDQAETVLLHLLRGTGLEGLAAMAPREGLRFRPLLGVWRAEVADYCRQAGLEPVDDPTNRDLGPLRNRIRHQLLPSLASLNPAIRESLCRLALAARAEHEVVVAAASRWLEAAPPTALSRASFNREPEAVRAEILRQVWGRETEVQPGGATKITEALGLLARAGPGSLDLGGGLRLEVSRASFRLVRHQSANLRPARSASLKSPKTPRAVGR